MRIIPSAMYQVGTINNVQIFVNSVQSNWCFNLLLFVLSFVTSYYVFGKI